MALTLVDVRAYLQSEWDTARNANDNALLAALAPIESQLSMIEGAKTLDEQKAGCQQLSAALLVIQQAQSNVNVARRLNDLRVEIGQFGFMGR